uniref:Uncharacterized protein n=1 Tax=Plectus sambesii TaxID=2011161 RepID=A0A914V839_9BILA
MGMQKERQLIAALVFFIVLTVGLVVALVIVATRDSNNNNNAPQQSDPYAAQLKQDNQMVSTIGQKLRQEIADNGLNHMKKNFYTITKMVHVAGTPEQMAALQYIRDTYASYGLEVMTTDYDVMLSYPNYSQPNTVSMQMSNGSWNLISNGLGDIPLGHPNLTAQLKADTRARNWWNGYGANGVATGKLVYANYGRVVDFQYLDNSNISLNGSIVAIRYGDLFRGNKVQEAEKRGALAVILFSDPIDYGSPDLSGSDLNNTFPNSVFMPPGGAQRGSVLETNGDPLTPLYPSKPYTYRIDISDVVNGVTAPNIPVMPMGYRDAATLFQNMNGPAVPAGWVGGIPGVNYTLTSSVSFKVTVNAITPTRQRIRNVIAFMRGTTEPDKYVLLTNHVDAWTFGAMDPNSGTVAILETARALTTVANATGWRPRRTIVFCSVDAEEFGLIGSTEFAEEYLKVLQQRAVALVNVDVAVAGNVVIGVESTPSLYNTIIKASKLIPNPNDNELSAGRKTIYDSWMFYFPNSSFIQGQPYMSIPDSGSDQSHFLSYVGVPCAALGYDCDPNIRRDCYELYHTMYEVPWTLENIIDRGYKALTAMSQLWTEVARDLADSLVIPFNVNDYATVLTQAISGLDVYLKGKGVPDLLTNSNANYSAIIVNLQDAASRFSNAATIIQKNIDAVNSGESSASLRQVEMLNSRLMGLERAFINDRGLYANRPDARHVMFATSIHDQYSGVLCAGVYDSAEYYFESTNDIQRSAWLKSIQVTLSELQFAVESAILLLKVTDY